MGWRRVLYCLFDFISSLSSTMNMSSLMSSESKPSTVLVATPILVSSSCPSSSMTSTKRRLLAPRQPLTSSSSYVLMSSSSSSSPAPLDTRRRATHNAIERRRRDNINTAIDKLAQLLPSTLHDGPNDDPHNSHSDKYNHCINNKPSNESLNGEGCKGVQSKGSILARVFSYITKLKHELQSHKDQLSASNNEVEWLKQQLSQAKRENEELRRHINQSSNHEADNHVVNENALASFLDV